MVFIIIFFVICVILSILYFAVFAVKDKNTNHNKRLKNIETLEVYFYCEKYQKWYSVKQNRIFPTIVREYRYNDTPEKSNYNWYYAEWNNPNNIIFLFLNYVLENYMNCGTTLAYDHKFYPLLKTVSSKIYLIVEENFVRTTYSYDYTAFYESPYKKDTTQSYENNYPSFYEFFNMNHTATFDDFKSRYRLLSKKYHPDNKNTGDSNIMTKINIEFESVKIHFKRK